MGSSGEFERSICAPAPVVIDVEGLSKWYGPYQVLHGIDLRVVQGERIVLCGTSGSGKSTLIRCLNRLEPAQQGRIQVLGADLSASPTLCRAALREVGMVFQGFNLFPHLTVLQNCMLAPMSVRGMPRDSAQDQAMALLKKVGIDQHWKNTRRNCRAPTAAGRDSEGIVHDPENHAVR